MTTTAGPTDEVGPAVVLISKDKRPAASSRRVAGSATFYGLQDGRKARQGIVDLVKRAIGL